MLGLLARGEITQRIRERLAESFNLGLVADERR